MWAHDYFVESYYPPAYFGPSGPLDPTDPVEDDEEYHVYQELGSFRNVVNFDTLAVSSSVVTLTESKITNQNVYSNATEVLITVDGSSTTEGIRWTANGTAPVSGSVGHFLPRGKNLRVTGQGSLLKLKMIRESADCTVQVTYVSG